MLSLSSKVFCGIHLKVIYLLSDNAFKFATTTVKGQRVKIIAISPRGQWVNKTVMGHEHLINMALLFPLVSKLEIKVSEIIVPSSTISQIVQVFIHRF